MQLSSAPRILVTGATGFLGLAFVRRLLAAGTAPERLVCVVRDPGRAAAQGLPPPVLRRGDVTAPDSLREAAAGIDVAVHLAGSLKANSRDGFAAVNVAGTEHLVAAVRSGAPRCHFVLVSSLAAAGPSSDGAGTAAPPEHCRPVSAYGESKRRGELAVRASGLAHTIVRPPVVYGPGDAATRLLFRQALAPICAVPPTARPLSVVHVEDVARALALAIGVAPRGAVLPLDGPERTDTHAFMRAIAKAAGRRARLLPVPLPVAGAAATVADLCCRMLGRTSYFNRDKVRELAAVGWCADGGPAREALGFSAEIDLDAGLAGVAAAEGFRRATARAQGAASS